MPGSSSPILPFAFPDSVPDIDRAIIGQLGLDGRVTVSRLAELTGATPATVRHHLNALLSSGRVSVVGLADPALLTRPTIAYLTVHTIAAAGTVAALLAEADATEWIATTNDLSTVICQVSCQDNASLVAFIDTEVRPLDGVRSVSVHSILRSFSTPYSSLGSSDEGAPPAVWTGNSPDTTMPEIDATDRLILGSLQVNGRASFTALADACGLSVPATRQRFLSLRSRSLVHIRCHIAPEMFGLGTGATLRMVCLDHSTRTAQALAAIPEATWVTQLTGTWDLALEVQCRDTAHLSEIYRQVAAMPAVGETELHQYDTLVKSSFRWSH